MRTSEFLLLTLREAPAEAETASHRLLLRAGMVRQLAAGIYNWLPLGLRVLRKVEGIVREEMNRGGAQELLMTGVQPAELWRKSGRWEEYGPELLRFRDRHEREFCLGPTHEEVITDLARGEIRSYRRLPICLYQIQSKFRDEIRPRFGILRGREFLMKDAYSFHLDEDCLRRGYKNMRAVYHRIFSRLGLTFRVVTADSGNIGGSVSEEFHVLAESGEDQIALSDSSDYAANLELTPPPPPGARPPPVVQRREVTTPGAHSIEEVAALLEIEARQCLKSLVVQGSDGGLILLVLRGDHQLNRLAAENRPEVAKPLRFATEKEIRDCFACSPGSLGPRGSPLPILADEAAAACANFCCGANLEGRHDTGVNWVRDLPEPHTAVLRLAQANEAAPGGGRLRITRGIEVGHIFQLGSKYSAALGAVVLDAAGKPRTLEMGCYGIGVSRVVAAAIEQHHDARGIRWPLPMAPFQVVVVPVNQHKSGRLRAAVTQLYERLLELGVEVLYDDRHARPGVLFADAELIGVPYWLVLGERDLDLNEAEFRIRDTDERLRWPIPEAAERTAHHIAGQFSRSSSVPDRKNVTDAVRM